MNRIYDTIPGGRDEERVKQQVRDDVAPVTKALTLSFKTLLWRGCLVVFVADFECPGQGCGRPVLGLLALHHGKGSLQEGEAGGGGCSVPVDGGGTPCSVRVGFPHRCPRVLGVCTCAVALSL